MYEIDEMVNRIKQLKKERKYSNEVLAEKSGIPKGTLAKILGSETKDPQISNIIKIARVFGVSADYLIFGREEPKYNDEYSRLFSIFNSAGREKVISYMKDLSCNSDYTEQGIANDLPSDISLAAVAHIKQE